MRRIKLARLLIAIMGMLPKRYPLHTKKPLPQPFFVFGSGRNGSTMLNLILNQHPDIFVPSEQYFLGNTIIKYQLYNWLIWRDLGKILAGELLPNLGSHTWSMDTAPLMKQIILAKKDTISLEGLIFSIYQFYAQQYGKNLTIWGDTTFMNTYYAKEIFHQYPSSKYIFLLRDGRDVAASFKNGGADAFHDWSKPAVAAMHWNCAIDTYDWLNKKTMQLLLVKYEDLVREPKQQLDKITAYLGTAPSENMLTFFEKVPKNEFYAPQHHQNLKNPINTASIGHWRNFLTSEEENLATKIMTTNLKRFRYL